MTDPIDDLIAHWRNEADGFVQGARNYMANRERPGAITFATDCEAQARTLRRCADELDNVRAGEGRHD